ncbi:FAD-binding oxidoreductase [Jeotgalibaca sp. MA1X17-3]|uniref:NAD(P)/FAD-dependent oxidoreductase n=1 Tax=Jeotgalibaca sp. MA1X17-3 TaxID=2908211 RepID=UPI002882EE92|nr:FAD-binding oxidoreductase [Jeotgalibaca sp. MA1X17-3]
MYVVRKNNTDIEVFDKIILATGAWLPQVLEPLGWKVDVRGQKGQLAVLQTDNQKNGSLPVLIPTGEIDILPVGKGTYYVGASHENEKGYDLHPDKEVINQLIRGGTEILTSLQNATLIGEKVGTRAYTSDFSPFFGFLPNSTSVFVASGLGSSGLTTGPYIGFQLALLAQGKPSELSLEEYDPGIYLKNMNNNIGGNKND